MASVPNSRFSAGSNARRTTGLLLALGFAFIALGVVLYVFVGHRESPKSKPIPPGAIDIGRPPTTGPGGVTDISQLAESGSARLQFTDKADANRVASELAYERLDPVGAGYFTLTQPRAWLYFRDGRTLFIRADSGRVKMPNRMQQPESGEFRGQVVVRLFPAPKDTRLVHLIDPDRDQPALLAVTDSINFDTVLLELSTEDALTISTPNLLFVGEGLNVRANQVAQRLELVRTKGRFVRFNPLYKPGPTPTSAPAPTPTASTTPAQPAAPEPAPVDLVGPAWPLPRDPREQLYKAVISGDVRVTQTSRTLTADTLDLFARLIDNRLPDNAFGIPPKPATKPATAPADATVAAQPDAPPSPDSPTPAPSTTTKTARREFEPGAPTNALFPPIFQSAGDEDIVMRWSGSLLLTPLPDQPVPPELADGNHFAGRFSSDKPGGEPFVLMTDTAAKAVAKAAQLEYAATSRTVALLPGPDQPRVHFEAENSVRLDVPSLKASLLTGVAQVPGGGLIASLRRKDAPPIELPDASGLTHDISRQITWTDQADFKFLVASGLIQPVLELANFTGDVVARDRQSSIGGDFLSAEFTKVGTQVSALKRLKIDGHALAMSGAVRADPDRAEPSLQPYLSSGRLDVSFQPVQGKAGESGEVEPVRALASKGVRAANLDATLRAQELDAAFGRDEKNTIIPTKLHAEGEVTFERTDGVMARSDTLTVDPVSRAAELMGKVVALSRGDSTILGTRVQLSDSTGRLNVIGAGSFEHTQPLRSAQQLANANSSGSTPTNSDDVTRVHATWDRGMVFDNAAGTIDADGSTTVTSTSPELTQSLRSERLLMWLTPAASVQSSNNSNASTTNSANPATEPLVVADRRLLRAEALGSSFDSRTGKPASVESRRYAVSATPDGSAPQRTLEQVMYLEGARLIADEEHGLIRVPVPGRAVVRDQRAAEQHPAPAPRPPSQSAAPASTLLGANTGGRGTSRFVWAESAEFDHVRGLLRMNRDVELTHLPLGQSQATRLVAMSMEAAFGRRPGASSEPRATELLSAQANGAVYAENGAERLISDMFRYDAVAGTAEAAATGDNRVTFYDDRKGTSLVARKLAWDLVRDRVEITEPAPVAAPR